MSDGLHGDRNDRKKEQRPRRRSPSSKNRQSVSTPDVVRSTGDLGKSGKPLNIVAATKETVHESSRRPINGNNNATPDFHKPFAQSFHIKWISSTTTAAKKPIVMQDKDGPCSLLTAANILLLRGDAHIQPGTMSITVEELLIMLSNCVGSKKTSGLKLFTWLQIPLVHGWVVDESEPTSKVIHGFTFDELMDTVIQKTEQGLMASNFYDKTKAEQLTDKGFRDMKASLAEGSFEVLFRCNHFSVVTKHGDELFCLANDLGYLEHPKIIWQRLTVNGLDGYYDENFISCQNEDKSNSKPRSPAVSSGNSPFPSPQQTKLDEEFKKSSCDPKKGQFPKQIDGRLDADKSNDKVKVSSISTARGKLQRQSPVPLRDSLSKQKWEAFKSAIGGLDEKLEKLFRRALQSRLLQPEEVEKRGLKHIRGILLYGPPGNGKTLIAREICKLLDAVEPKIFNGPEIFEKYVGESESKVRSLFQDAEDEAKRMGQQSRLHVIIIDELDAIGKRRGASAINDRVVNQLLTKIDGMTEVNNVLIIGMTNRADSIDEALLRSGRLEVKIRIDLPNEEGRKQILGIHMKKLRENGYLAPDVDIIELSANTKHFSGADLEALVRAAESYALQRMTEHGSGVVTRDDFVAALSNDVQPAFRDDGSAQIDRVLANGFLLWSDPVFQRLSQIVQSMKGPTFRGLVSILLEGPPDTGKTTLAAKVAKDSNIKSVNVCAPENMHGLMESEKCAALAKAFADAEQSQMSIVLVDDLLAIPDYERIGNSLHLSNVAASSQKRSFERT